MMRIFIFKSRSENDLYGATQDKTGANLPEKFGPWSFHSGPHEWNADDEPRIGVNAIEGLSVIQEKGYYLWKVTVSTNVSL